jgi:hypothetical protein
VLVSAGIDPKDNEILGALPSAIFKRWQKSLEDFDLPLGKVLYEPGTVLSRVYFRTPRSIEQLTRRA